MDRHEHVARVKQGLKKWTATNRDRLVAMRQAGATYIEIARSFDISRSTARDHYLREMRLQETRTTRTLKSSERKIIINTRQIYELFWRVKDEISTRQQHYHGGCFKVDDAICDMNNTELKKLYRLLNSFRIRAYNGNDT